MPLWESAFHATMAVVLWRLESRAAFRWQLIKLYLIAYCMFRFCTEFVRTEPRIALGLTAYQYGAVAFAAALTLLWVVDEGKKSEVVAAA